MRIARGLVLTEQGKEWLRSHPALDELLRAARMLEAPVLHACGEWALLLDGVPVHGPSPRHVLGELARAHQQRIPGAI